jgi:hypothetical protein
MPFPPPQNHVIALSDAAELTTAFQRKFPGSAKAGMFPIEVLLELSRQAGCHGLRIYFGLDKEGNVVPVLAGVDANQNDQLPAVGKAADGGEGNQLYEFSYPCPIFCGEGNALNGG